MENYYEHRATDGGLIVSEAIYIGCVHEIYLYCCLAAGENIRLTFTLSQQTGKKLVANRTRFLTSPGLFSMADLVLTPGISLASGQRNKQVTGSVSLTKCTLVEATYMPSFGLMVEPRKSSMHPSNISSSFMSTLLGMPYTKPDSTASR